MNPATTAAPLRIWLHGIGVLAPGLDNWPAAAAVLTGAQPWRTAATVLPAPGMLPAAERRRASRIIKLVMAVGSEAVRQSGLDAATLASVFSASTGDGHNCHAICEVLASSQRDVSPTRFHNSVHNTAAGYWCIAAQATGPCQVLAAYDASFASGLYETAIQTVAEQRDVLLQACDTDYPEPLLTTRPVPDAAGVALVLRPQPTSGALAQLDIGWHGDDTPPTSLGDAALEALGQQIPAMRALPLLQALARQQAATVHIAGLPGQTLQVRITPCP